MTSEAGRNDASSRDQAGADDGTGSEDVTMDDVRIDEVQGIDKSEQAGLGGNTSVLEGYGEDIDRDDLPGNDRGMSLEESVPGGVDMAGAISEEDRETEAEDRNAGGIGLATGEGQGLGGTDSELPLAAPGDALPQETGILPGSEEAAEGTESWDDAAEAGGKGPGKRKRGE